MNKETIYHPHIADSEHTMTEVYLPVEDEVYGLQYDKEALKAEPIGKRGQYRIICIPFITYGYNKGDVVSVDKNKIVNKKIIDDGQYGYRIAFPYFQKNVDPHSQIDEVLGSLAAAGFDVEEFNHKISAVNAINSEKAIELEKIIAGLIRDGKIEAYDTIR